MSFTQERKEQTQDNLTHHLPARLHISFIPKALTPEEAFCLLLQHTENNVSLAASSKNRTHVA